MNRIHRITAAATGLPGGGLTKVRHRLWWLGVPAATTLLAAGLLATAPAASAYTGPAAAGVRLIQAGNDLLMAGIGHSDNIDVLYQPVGGSSWSEVTATAPNTVLSVEGPVYAPIAITAVTERIGFRTTTLIALAAEGPDNSLNFWWQSLADIGSGPWHQEVIAGPNSIVTSPSIVQVGNDIGIAAEEYFTGNPGYTVQFWWQQVGATGWNNFPIPSTDAASAPAMAALNSPSGTLGITWTDIYGDVMYAQQAPAEFGKSWQGPYSVDSEVTFPETPSIAALDGGLTAITTITNNDGLDSWMTPDPPAFVTTTNNAFPGTVFNTVATAQLGGGVVAATTEYYNDDLEFYWRLDDGLWNREDLGSATAYNTSSPPLAALTNSAGTHLVATAVENANGSVDFYWQTVGSSSWATIYLPAGTFGG